MNIILDNIIFNLQKSGGISVYWSELLKNLQCSNDLKIKFIDYKSDNIFQKKTDLSTSDVCHEIFTLPLIIRRFIQPLIRIKEKSIFHSSYFRIIKHRNVINVVTVHDFTYEYYLKGLGKYLHSWQKKRAIRYSDSIICVSINTKNDLLKFYPEAKNKKIRVIYNGVSSIFRPIDKECFTNTKFQKIIQSKYLLFIGKRLSYKNFDLVVNSLEELREYQLVMVGGGSLNADEIEKLNKMIPNRFAHFGNINDEELNILYNFAFVLVYPSKYEGFGIPIVEAMSAQCPVICSQLSSLPEISNGAAVLLEDCTKEHLNRAILSLEDQTIREKYIRLGCLRACEFSWDKNYLETLSLYKELYYSKHEKK